MLPHSHPFRTAGILRRAAAFAIAAILHLLPAARAQESVYGGAFPGFNGTLSNLTNFELQSGKGAAIANFFRNWEDGNGTLGFPTATMTGFRNHGSIPMISWQPQGHRADSHYKLSNILNGNFDNFIRNWALAAKAWGHPFFLRFAHEMNGTWYPWCAGVNGNTSADYVAAWRHVRDIFTRNGVTNVTWVWCPNTNYSGSTPLAGLYPGDNYVDWISTDAYNRITNNWGHFSARAGPTLTDMINLVPGKPIMIAETGCHRDEDKSGTPPGSKAQWYRTALKDYLKNSAPRVKAWVYFNGNNPDGNNWRIDTSQDVMDAYRESIGLSYYSDNKYAAIAESPIRPLLNDAKATDTMAPFVSIDQPRVNKVQAGSITEIHTSASDKSGITKVEYFINGVLSRTENLFPYQYFWPVPSGAGASYTILCKAYDGAGNTATSTIQVVSVHPPGTPSGIAASDGTFTDKVRVTWNAVASVNGYQVWRNTTDSTSGAALLTATPVTGTTFDDVTAEYSTTYHYWVRSVDDSGPGAFGGPDTGHRLPPAPPPAPGGVYATDGIYNTRVLVGWNSVATATGYEVWRNSVNNSATAEKITPAPVTGTTFNDTTVPYAVNHFYWVKALNDGGASPFGNTAAGYRGNLPTIGAIADRTTNESSSTGPIAFTVGDNETPAAELALSAFSSNIALAPVENIVFGGSGANRTVTITPAAGLAGSATITITVTDADGGQKSGSFVLTVNALPVISPLSDRAIAMNSGTGAIAFTIGDAETPAGSLVVTGSSSNTALVPNAQIVFGGSGSNRTVTVTPASGQAGTAEISVHVSDGTGTAVETFFLSVLDANQALWTATATGSPLPWSHGPNWQSGLPPQSGPSTSLIFLAGSSLAGGAVNPHNDISSPFDAASVTLAGEGPAAAAQVQLTGGALRFVTPAAGGPPVLNLAATSAFPFHYNLAMPIVLGATTTIDGGGNATFALDGAISGGGGITKTGAATLILAGANSYTGRTAIQGGNGSVLRVTHPSALGLNGALQTNTGAVSPVIQLHIDGAGSDGVIPMSNGFGGNSNIVTTIDVSNNGGGSTGNVIQLNGHSTGWGNNVTLNVTGSHGHGLHLARLKSTGGIPGTETFNPTTAPLTIGTYEGANNPTTLALGGTHAGNAILGAIADGASTVAISKSNGSTWHLAGASTFTGTVQIHGGSLVVSHSSALGAASAGTSVSSGGGRLVLRGGISLAEPVSLGGRAGGDHLVNESGANTLAVPLSLTTGGNNYFLRSTAGKLVVADAVDMLSSTATKTLHIAGGGDTEFLGAISPGTGTLGLSKSGAGLLSLTAECPLNGPVHISSGTLAVHGGLPAAAAVTIAADGTLTGSGAIAAATAIDGRHAPGTGAGHQTFASSLAYGPAAKFTWELVANSTDLIAPADPENPGPPVGDGFDTVSADSVSIAPGAVIDVVLDAPGSAVDFTSGFWKSPRSWPVLAADTLDGQFALGSVGTDASGRDAAESGAFSLRRVGSMLVLDWAPNDLFAAWLHLHFGEDADNPEIAGDLADPDGDGLANLVEYALGTLPGDPGPAGITCDVAGGEISMIHPLSKHAAGITVRAEWSDDLETWSDAQISTEDVADDGTVITRKATAPAAGSPRRFMRLVVTRP